MRPLLLSLALFLIPASSEAHEWYSGLRSLDGTVCCSGVDCREITKDQIKFESGKMWINTEEFGWLPVERGSYVAVEPPDGKLHACWLPSSPRIRCAVMPGQS